MVFVVYVIRAVGTVYMIVFVLAVKLDTLTLVILIMVCVLLALLDAPLVLPLLYVQVVWRDIDWLHRLALHVEEFVCNVVQLDAAGVKLDGMLLVEYALHVLQQALEVQQGV